MGRDLPVGFAVLLADLGNGVVVVAASDHLLEVTVLDALAVQILLHLLEPPLRPSQLILTAPISLLQLLVLLVVML